MWLPSILLGICLLFTISVSQPLNTTTSSLDAVSIPFDATSLPDIDPHFRITAKDGGTLVDRLSAIMDALSLLKRLALQDYNGDTKLEIVNQKPWNKVIITSEPTATDTISRRYVIWGLYQSLEYCAKNRFWTAVFYSYYNSVRIGRIFYSAVKDPSQQPLVLDSTAEINATLTNGSTDLDPGLQHENIKIQTAFIQNAKRLSIQGYFLPLAAGLVHLAAIGSTNRLKSFVSNNVDFQTRLEVEIPQGAAPCNVGDATKAVIDIATLIAVKKTFAEAEATMKDPFGSLIGYVRLRQGVSSPIAAPDMTAVATS